MYICMYIHDQSNFGVGGLSGMGARNSEFNIVSIYVCMYVCMYVYICACAYTHV